jgi:nicotinate-nucleotide pyrophosphorylase (carboxylating)
MNHADLKSATLTLIDLAFKEDFNHRGDITGKAVGMAAQAANARIVAKQSGVICGVDVVQWVFAKADETIEFKRMVQDGDQVNSGQDVLRLSGPASAILAAERTALNFLGRLSGIATQTRHFVDAVQGTRCRILDTRKTIPGWRLLEKYAVRCGGGENHRFGLYDMFLIKENHIAAAGSITSAVQQCRDYMCQNHFNAGIEVETQALDDVEEALTLGVDRIMLDNMPAEMMQPAVARVNGAIPLEASGNVTQENVRAVAETGVDYISIGAMTHSAPVFDVSMLFDELND